MKARQVTHNGKTKYKIEWTADGKRKRKFFPTKAAANRFITDHENKTRQVGFDTASAADAEFIRVAVKCQKQLEAHGKGLADATSFYLKHLETLRTGATLGELADEYLAAIPRWTGERRQMQVTYKLGRFVREVGDTVKVGSITTAFADSWLDGLGVQNETVNGYRNVLRAFYAWCERRGYVDANPIAKIEKRKVVRQLPPIFSIEQTRILLAKAQSDEKLMAWVALGLFAGLRTAEIERIGWEQIHSESETIDLTFHGKGARRRFVTIRPILKSILSEIRQMSGPVVGQRFTQTYRVIRFKDALGFDWPHNGLRHSFATYHLAAFEDAGKTALQMGHGANPSMLFQHYNRPGITRDEALRYWGETDADTETNGKGAAHG